MAKALQRRRGTTEEHQRFTGLEGEFTYDTTEKRVVAHDGETPGGIPMAKKEDVRALFDTDGSLLKKEIIPTVAAADKLSSARKVSITGDASGSGSFDGSTDISLSMSLASTGVAAGSYGPSSNASPGGGQSFAVPYVTVDAKGRVTSVASRTITMPNHVSSSTTANNVNVANVVGLAVGAINYSKTSTSYGCTFTVQLNRDNYGRVAGLAVSGANCNCNCDCNCNCGDSDSDGG